jgi:hypothetical protein
LPGLSSTSGAPAHSSARRPPPCPAPPHLPAPPPLPPSAQSIQPRRPKPSPPLPLPGNGRPPSAPAINGGRRCAAVHRLTRGPSVPLATYKTPPPSSSPPRTAQSSFSSPSTPPPQGTRRSTAPRRRSAPPPPLLPLQVAQWFPLLPLFILVHLPCCLVHRSSFWAASGEPAGEHRRLLSAPPPLQSRPPHPSLAVDPHRPI